MRMLSFDMKRKINTLRDILVGKIPDPKSQVEQITIAMVFKFMDDMDREFLTDDFFGGNRKFFVDTDKVKYSRYAWTNIMNPQIGGQEKADLYREGIEAMQHNPNLPQFFRDVFRNVYIPFRDSETIKLFLTEINEFSYDNSEDLGEAFEMLLSIMSSQGDAGQFRTPRHIIDMIVDIVQPTKTDKILDPACGTAGFLISAYKYILEYNRDAEGRITLTPDEKTRLMQNFEGYDISQDMVRLSSVNMYLHHFPDPKIHEYDTLTAQDRWDDQFDVIFANPPFMTPKGGINPHNRFRVKAKRSEILFVDYIAEHLAPNGRAGIIVPEGIVFQSANAYKDLRKYLVDEGLLYAVISLPTGVFNPYSGVKTSVLLIDKSFAKQRDDILFVKLNNDGFDLGAQRRPIRGSEILVAVKLVNNFKAGKDISESPLVTIAKKEVIAEQDYILVGERYKQVVTNDSKYPMVKLGDVCEVIAGQSPDGQYYNEDGQGTPFYQGKTEFTDRLLGSPQKWTTRITKTAVKNDIVMSVRAPVGPVNIATEDICIGRGLAAIRSGTQVLTDYIFYLLKSIEDRITGNYGAAFSSINKKEIEAIEIPLPPLSVQEEIIAKIETYQKIIDGAKQIDKNYKPTIKIDSNWETVKLGDVCVVSSGGTPDRNSPEYWNGDIPYVKTGLISFNEITETDEFISQKGVKNSSARIIPVNTVLMAMYGQGVTRGRVAILKIEAAINQAVAAIIIKNNKMLDEKYLFLFLQSQYEYLREISNARGGNQSNINGQMIKCLEVPLPTLEIQRQIVAQFNEEMVIIKQNKRLIEIFEQKITDTINQVWISGEPEGSVSPFFIAENTLQYAARNCSDKFAKAVQQLKDSDSDE